MLNPFLTTASITLNAIDNMIDRGQRVQALSLVLAQAATKALEGFRRRVNKLDMPLTFDRHLVEGLDNAHHYMRIEMAKMLGLAILDNEACCLVTREQSDDKVMFTAAVALVPKEDWNE